MTQSSGQEMPPTISLLALADRFKETERMMPNRAFAFVLGAGASRSSGIKGAAQMVDDWIPLLHREVIGNADGDAKTWATAQTLGIAHYDPADPAAAYSELYRRMYARDPDRGYAYLEEQMRNAEPSYGYSVLARIMETTRHKVVVTTNFDNLVADSLSIFSKTYPLVCGHESLAGFISARVRRPLVVKVHRDLLLAPKSTPEDLGALPDGFSNALAEIFRHYTPIVIGYGGNDGSLMKFLKDLPPRSVPGGVYWCHWDEGESPPEEIQHFVAAQQGALVPIPGFDEAMMLLGEALEFDVPDKFVLDRAEARAKRIVEQVQALQTRLKKRTHRAPALADAEVGASDAITQAVEKTMQRTSGTLRWWQWEQRAEAATDLDVRDRIYREAIAALPESAELLGNYANFLRTVPKDCDQAEAYYTKALAADPTDAGNLGNYATFLEDVRKDYDQAEAYYTNALAADPTNANNLCNYAIFLHDVRKDDDQAQAYFTNALAADPTHTNTLGNYAVFLKNVRNDDDQAEAYFTKALAADPTNANNLGNYASFLEDVRKDYDQAEAYFTKALAADPTNANNLGNYACFLHNVRKDYDQAEAYYTKALAADPTNANNLGNYAAFLDDVRKDYDQAETYYTKVLAADPTNANILGNYANFLRIARKDDDQAEAYYTKALAADPTHANNLGNYASFLLALGRTDEGLAMLERGLSVLGPLTPNAQHVETWMYATCHWLPERWHDALGKLKPLLLVDKITTGDWDFSGVIEAAKKREHPAAEWLDPLASVCAGTADASTLDGWDAWQAV